MFEKTYFCFVSMTEKEKKNQKEKREILGKNLILLMNKKNDVSENNNFFSLAKVDSKTAKLILISTHNFHYLPAKTPIEMFNLNNFNRNNHIRPKHVFRS